MKTAYTRYLRDIKNAPSGSAAKKKKWHLADAMSFLVNYAGPQRKIISNLPPPSIVRSIFGNTKDSEDTEDLVVVGIIQESSKFPADEPESQADSIEVQRQDVIIAKVTPKERKKNKSIRSSAAEIVAGPVAEYLKTVTAQSRGKSQESEDPTLLFFKSIVPDVKKLSSRKQRSFKAKVMELLNSMFDSQEDSELANFTNPPSVQTVISHTSRPPSNLTD